MRIVVTGATGSIGRRLVPALLARGERVAVVTRRPREARRLFGGEVEVVAGDTSVPGPWQLSVEGARAVVHLAGASISHRRWTRRQRALIESSRVDGTYQVATAIEEARERPAVLVSASATGYYGDCGDERIHERFPPGASFISDVCVRWEAEARRVEQFGVRVVLARIGVVLDEDGPALQRLLPWFRAACGATIASGYQWMPWIWHGDATTALLRCIDHASLSGAVNVTAPEPCTQRTFAKALGEAVGRPVFLRVPAPALRVAFGGLADELIASKRVVPQRLLDDGLAFEAPSIDDCMEALAREDHAAAPAPRARPAPPAPRASPPPSRAGRPAARPRLLIVSHAVVDGGGVPRTALHETVRTVAGRGCAVVLASAHRGPALGAWLSDPLLYPIAIAANGAVLWHHRDGRAVHSERMDHATLAGATLAIREAAASIELVFEGEDWIAAARDSIPGFGRVDLRLAPGELPPKPTVRLHATGGAEAVAAARAAILPFWRERKLTLFAGPASARPGDPEVSAFTLAAPTVDRAVAAQRIARRIGASRDEVMAIVASDDDLGLTDWCGFSLALADAPPSVRRHAGATLSVGRGGGPESDPFVLAVRKYVTE